MSAASAFLGALAVKRAVLFLMGLGAARLLRGAPASLRHGAWALTFAGALSLPLLTLAVPG